MKMNFLTVTGKKQLYTHRSLPPPPNRLMLWESRTDSPLLQNPRAQSCQFCWRKIHGGKSRGRSDWADCGAAKAASVRCPAPPKPQHCPAAQTATQQSWAQLQTATSSWTDRLWVLTFPYQGSETILLIENADFKITLCRPTLEFSIVQ